MRLSTGECTTVWVCYYKHERGQLLMQSMYLSVQCLVEKNSRKPSQIPLRFSSTKQKRKEKLSVIIVDVSIIIFITTNMPRVRTGWNSHLVVQSGVLIRVNVPPPLLFLCMYLCYCWTRELPLLPCLVLNVGILSCFIHTKYLNEYGWTMENHL